jgi:serine/threonine-protein kinase
LQAVRPTRSSRRYVRMEPHPGMSVTPNVRLVRPLGRGGMGSVWLAEHLALDTRVAVKFISPDVPKSLLPALLERFQREAKAAAKIRSPHVVEIKDLGAMPGGGPFIVMELLEGESLGDRLERIGTMSPPETATLVAQVAKALGAAHALGVLHRDIKPDNIFLMMAHDELLVKVLDFGIAKLADVRSA